MVGCLRSAHDVQWGAQSSVKCESARGRGALVVARVFTRFRFFVPLFPRSWLYGYGPMAIAIQLQQLVSYRPHTCEASAF
jgi:hypothetical protein